MVISVCVVVTMASADSLQLKNGSLINGMFMGGTESEISFQVGSSTQKYDRADIASRSQHLYSITKTQRLHFLLESKCVVMIMSENRRAHNHEPRMRKVGSGECAD